MADLRAICHGNVNGAIIDKAAREECARYLERMSLNNNLYPPAMIPDPPNEAPWHRRVILAQDPDYWEGYRLVGYSAIDQCVDTPHFHPNTVIIVPVKGVVSLIMEQGDIHSVWVPPGDPCYYWVFNGPTPGFDHMQIRKANWDAEPGSVFANMRTNPDLRERQLLVDGVPLVRRPTRDGYM